MLTTVGGMFVQALRIMGMGFGVVFMVLALFFALIKALIRLFPEKKGKKE